MSPARRRLAAATLYLVCDDLPDAAVEAAIAGGVDAVQLRMKDADDADVLAAAARVGSVCARHDVLFVLNDRPDLAAAADADGVHVGQDDLSPAQARELVGADRVIGLSTHSPAQVDAAAGDPDVDYTGVGPVYATPTKPGRAAVGLELVSYAAAAARAPFFAIGGIDADAAAAVARAGARRIAVVRAITQARDPERAARELRAALGPGAVVGARA